MFFSLEYVCLIFFMELNYSFLEVDNSYLFVERGRFFIGIFKVDLFEVLIRVLGNIGKEFKDRCLVLFIVLILFIY